VTRPRIYADFHNGDAQGRLRLTCVGTIQDLARQKVELKAGLVLTLYADDADSRGQPDDLEIEGVVEYSDAERCWVAQIDWSAIRHASDVRIPLVPDTGTFDAPIPDRETA
jgi:hypothetical protein